MPRVGMKLGYARCIAGEGGSVKRCRGLSRHPSNYSTDYSPELKMIRLFFLPLESEKRFSSRLERNWRFVARLSRMENASLRSYKDLCFAFDSNDNFLFSFFLFYERREMEEDFRDASLGRMVCPREGDSNSSFVRVVHLI